MVTQVGVEREGKEVGILVHSGPLGCPAHTGLCVPSSEPSAAGDLFKTCPIN